MSEDLLYEVRKGVAFLTINREERRNAISQEMMKAFVEYLDQAENAYARMQALAELAERLQQEKAFPEIQALAEQAEGLRQQVRQEREAEVTEEIRPAISEAQQLDEADAVEKLRRDAEGFIYEATRLADRAAFWPFVPRHRREKRLQELEEYDDRRRARPGL